MIKPVEFKKNRKSDRDIAQGNLSKNSIRAPPCAIEIGRNKVGCLVAVLNIGHFL